MEKKNFLEKENQPLSNHRSDCYIYIYERWHPPDSRLWTVDCETQNGNGMTWNPKMEIFEPVGNRLLVDLLARAN